VIRADHPNRAVWLQHAAAFREPVAREAIVVGTALELVPRVVDAIDAAVVRANEVALELKIVRGVGEDEVYASWRKSTELVDTLTVNNSIFDRTRARTTTLNHVTQLSTTSRTWDQSISTTGATQHKGNRGKRSVAADG